MTDFDPMAVTGPGKGHNSGETTKADIFKGIDSLYEEAAQWADGTDIENDAQHAAVTAIRDALHELGKKADDIRVAEKKPHDDAAAAVQKEFNPYIQAKKGKVDRAKSCLDQVTARWRVKIQREKEEAARIAREKADEERRAAQEAIRSSRDNILAREEAEEKLAAAKRLEVNSRRAEREATTRTGLRTVTRIELPEDGRADALDWAFERDGEAFYRLAIELATDQYRATKRVAPGFKLVEEKVGR